MKFRDRLWEDIAVRYSVGLSLWREDKSCEGFNVFAYYQFVVCRDLIRRHLPDQPRDFRLWVGAEISDALRRESPATATASVSR